MFRVTPLKVERASTVDVHGINVCNRNAFHVIGRIEGKFNISIVRAAQMACQYVGNGGGSEDPLQPPPPLEFDWEALMAAHRWEVPLLNFAALFQATLYEQGSDEEAIEGGATVTAAKTSFPDHALVFLRIHVHRLSSQHVNPFVVRVSMTLGNGDALMAPFTVAPLCVTSRPMTKTNINRRPFKVAAVVSEPPPPLVVQQPARARLIRVVTPTPTFDDDQCENEGLAATETNMHETVSAIHKSMENVEHEMEMVRTMLTTIVHRRHQQPSSSSCNHHVHKSQPNASLLFSPFAHDFFSDGDDEDEPINIV